MTNFLNAFYRNQDQLYKFFLLVITTVFIVFIFPKSGRFKYDFEKGKPWQSQNLYAPFDFAVEKSQEELDDEFSKIEQNKVYYFDKDVAIQSKVKRNLKVELNNQLPDSLNDLIKKRVVTKSLSLLNTMYSEGVYAPKEFLLESHQVIILDAHKKIANLKISQLFNRKELKLTLERFVKENNLLPFTNILKVSFYNSIEPNLILNNSLTNKVFKEELAAVSTTRGLVAKETLIISKGELVSGEKYAVLKSLKNQYESRDLNQYNFYWVVAAYTLLVALVLIMLLLFLKKYRPSIYSHNTKITFIFFNIVLMVLLTVLIVNYNSDYVYVIPIAILPLVLKAFFDARLGLFTHVLTVLLLGSVVPNSYEYMFLQIIAGIVTILTVSELYKRANLFISVGQITAIYIIAYFAFFVIHENAIERIEFSTFGYFVICGLATLFVQPLIYIYEKLFGLVSDVSLLELSDTNSKLLKRLANEAPGTFHHSLNVANLAEACANEIDANAMLIRVGALYHDIGKIANPTFFTENQVSGLNPHNELSAKESAQTIIGHTIKGIEIARKYQLPERVIEFIRTHHGTSLVYYFYKQAMDQDGEVNENDFRYPGPIPFSKETAILMMCDSVEAASKSLKEPTTSKIDAFVDNIIAKQMKEGQFLNSNITFKEIELIKKVLKSKLSNIYHLRIEYPE